MKEGVEFGCFDILADQSVRNDLKKFSEWPTYPQLVCPCAPLIFGPIHICSAFLLAKLMYFDIFCSLQFVNGQLVGGLDIMKELKESGELGASLQ